MAWSISAEQRSGLAAAMEKNLTSIHFFAGRPIDADEAASIAQDIELRAYTKAQVGATTTTGARPHVEGVRMYARAAAQMLLEAVQSPPQAAGGALGGQATAAAGDLRLFDVGTSRDFVTKELAVKLFAPLTAGGALAAAQRVKLSCKSFGLEAAAVAAAALTTLGPRLLEADLSDIIAGRPEVEALAVLSQLCGALPCATLLALDLSDNALGEKGVRACGVALAALRAVQRLRFCNNGISSQAASALDELLGAAAGARTLRSIHFFNNMTGDAGAAHIGRLLARCPALEDLRLASSRVGAPGLAAVAHGLMAATRALERLDVSDNPVGRAGGASLQRLLAAQPRMHTLKLADLGLGPSGVRRVCAALAASRPPLASLDLTSNEAGAAGAAAIGALLGYLPTLSTLALAENEIRDAGAIAFVQAAGAVAGTALAALDVRANELTRTGALTLAQWACGRPALSSLELDGNYLSVQAVAELKSGMAQMGKGAALGTLEDNDPEGEPGDDEPDDEDEETAPDDAALLNEMLAKLVV